MRKRGLIVNPQEMPYILEKMGQQRRQIQLDRLGCRVGTKKNVEFGDDHK